MKATTVPQIMKRITGRKLQTIRAYHRQLDPLCVDCRAEGVVREWDELDHIVALVNGGKDEPSNRVGRCRFHHVQKTEVDMGRPAPRRIGVDGFPVPEATPIPPRGRSGRHGPARG